MNSRTRQRIIAIAFVTLLLLGGAWALLDGALAAQVDDSTLAGSGVIQAQTDVLLSAEMLGRIVYLAVDEGDEVQAGQTLVRLDDSLLQAQIAQAEAVVAAAQANLARVKAGVRPAQVEAAQAAVDSAQAQVNAAEAAADAAAANVQAAMAGEKAAQAQYAKLAAGPTAKQVELADKQIELAKVRLWAAQTTRDAARNGMNMPISFPLVIDNPELGKIDLGTVVIPNLVGPKQLDVEAAEARIVEAESSIRLADLQKQKLLAGASSQQLAIAQSDIARAQAEVQAAQIMQEQAQQAVAVVQAEVAQAQAQLTLVQAGATSEEIAVAEAQVAQAEAEVAILQARGEKLSLQTPIAGLVTERLINEGEVVISGARLLTISALDPVLLTIYVSESQLGGIQLGQDGSVSVDAYPGQTFAGEVVYISPQAEFTPRTLQTAEERTTIVFAVRIKIANPDRLLKPGMSAAVTLSGAGN